MHPLNLLLLVSPALLAPVQDSRARAELFVRPAPAPAEAGEVRAAVRIRIEPGWHLYHDDLGQPDAVGKPTAVEFEGAGASWSKTRFPDPIRIDQPGLGEGGRDTWIWAHEGTIVLFAAGRLASGADTSSVAVSLKGLTCEDDGSCIPWSELTTSKGVGPDALFASFPAELRAPGPAGEPQPEASDELPLSAGGSSSAEAAGRNEDHARAQLYLRRDGDTVRAAIEIQVAKGWHLYHDELGQPDSVGKPTTLELTGTGIEWGRPRFPAPERIGQPGVGDGGRDTWIWAHSGTFVVRVEGRLPAGASLDGVRARISGLTCDEGETCTPWSAEISSSGAGPDRLFADGSTPSSIAGGSTQPGAESLARFLWMAVFWGLFTLLMPCTYPMIPITISFFTKQAAQRNGSTLSLSMLYGLGIVAVFILIGVAFGAVIIPFATHPVTNLVIGLVFVLFSLALFGAIDLQPPRFLMDAAGRASRVGGPMGVFLMGATLVVTSFTCTAPFVGSLLAVGARDGDLPRIALGMGTFGLTMAVPFVLLSMLPRKISALPRSGEWMHVLKVFLGFVELAAALKFISNSDLVWGWNVFSRELFLLLWFGIFLVAAVFLFGLIHLKGEKAHEIGPLRMVGATAVLLFALYCLYGMTGHSLDKIMTAIVPNYSSRDVVGASAGGGGRQERSHVIVKDDYDAALARARQEQKLLLVNFTGFT